MRSTVIAERRRFLKKRLVRSTIFLSVILALTVFNCLAELFFPALILPISFYLPQFVCSMAARLSLPQSAIAFTLLCILALAIVVLIAVCLIFSRKIYSFVSFLNVVVSLDIVLLLYVGVSSLFINGFDFFFVVNLLLHVWMLSLTIRLRRSAEGLEVLPEKYVDDEDSAAYGDDAL